MPYITLHHVLNLPFINDYVNAIHGYRSHGSYSAFEVSISKTNRQTRKRILSVLTLKLTFV